MKHATGLLLAAAASAAIALASCGGGSGGMSSATDSGTGTSAGTTAGTGTGAAATGASTPLTSSGSITAFGSVFVNGREFGIAAANILDDDAGTSHLDPSTLEVGMSVDVVAAAASTASSPVAAEIHLHPLARGVVDASDNNAGTLSVMGQTVQLTAATDFSDHRACLQAATACTPIAGQSGLLATSGSGSNAVAGSYVTVFGYLYASGTSGSANIVASLVQVGDLPASPGPVAYKAEGLVSSATGSTLTIGGLTLDLSASQCFGGGASTPCAGAFASGQIVSAVGAKAPALPATQFQPGYARLRGKLAVQTEGAAIDLEGAVSSVTTQPAAFVLRGVAVDASTLAATSLPAVGDIVRVSGSVAAGGTSVLASSVVVLHAARSAVYGLEGDASGVTAGSASNSYVLSLLGQTVSVDATTRLADHSTPAGAASSSSQPFNITTFQSYLAASASQHLLVSAQADGTGALSAMAVTIVPASSEAGIEGLVDATPAPVNASPGGMTTFAVHGLAVSADPATLITGGMGHRALAGEISAGDLVLVLGTYAAGTLSVTAPASASMEVVDMGLPRGAQHGSF